MNKYKNYFYKYVSLIKNKNGILKLKDDNFSFQEKLKHKEREGD